MLVVGAALVRAGRVLAARRTAPAELAGRWEFPGGKVEAGESVAAALVRECAEELGVQVAALAEIAAAGDGRIELRLWSAHLLSGEPVALADHDELRWLAADELDAVDWLPVDVTLLPAVRALLG